MPETSNTKSTVIDTKIVYPYTDDYLGV